MKNIEIHSLPVLGDNYIHLIRDHAANVTIIVDPAEANAVLKFLTRKNWSLTHILITHHHFDHIGGVDTLKKVSGAQVIGATLDQHRLPKLDRDVSDGDQVAIGSLDFEVWHLPGHTTGHIAYIDRSHLIAFTGDVIFGMGCGRVFEGTMAQAFASLKRIAGLEPNMALYCTHEYTAHNGAFVQKLWPNHQAIAERVKRTAILRRQNQFTVPLTLSDELETNPFLWAVDVEEFTKLREERNHF